MRARSRVPAVVATICLLAATVLAQESPDEAATKGGLFGLFLGGEREPAARRTIPRRRPSPPPENVRVPPEPAAPAAESKPISPPERPARPASAAVPERSDPAVAPSVGRTPSSSAEPRKARKPRPPDGAAPPAKRAGVVLPEEEIRGEIEKPDIYFLLPRARDRSDEQVIRARLRREIRRPLIKEWLEETLLLE